MPCSISALVIAPVPSKKATTGPEGIYVDILRHGARQDAARRHHRAHVQRLFDP